MSYLGNYLGAPPVSTPSMGPGPAPGGVAPTTISTPASSSFTTPSASVAPATSSSSSSFTTATLSPSSVLAPSASGSYLTSSALPTGEATTVSTPAEALSEWYDTAFSLVSGDAKKTVDEAVAEASPRTGPSLFKAGVMVLLIGGAGVGIYYGVQKMRGK